MRFTNTLAGRWLAVVGMALLTTGFFGRCVSADPPKGSPSWWDPAWKYCQTVHMYTPPLASGINTVVAEIDPMGKALPDGRDVRVVTPQKTVLPHQIVKGEDGALKILFQAPADGTDTFFIYYGHPAAPPVQGQWEKRLGGLTMEVRALIPQKWISQWEQVQEFMSAGTQVFGRGPRSCINDSRNPFSSQQEHFCAIMVMN